jgi:Putative polyhydroxyalkanoic acid system protein (PHA_gran_rgn).
MPKPLIVSIPHRLGKAEAVRRLQAGLASVRSDFKHIFTVQEETWVGDSLTFRISAIGQTASGLIEVREDHVQMELQLPWLLHQIVEKAQGLIRKRGQLLLEKK